MIEVFNPTGTTGTTAPFAPRLKTLHGKKIGLLSNGHWQAERMLALLQELLRQEFPTTKSEIIAANDEIRVISRFWKVATSQLPKIGRRIQTQFFARQQLSDKRPITHTESTTVEFGFWG